MAEVTVTPFPTLVPIHMPSSLISCYLPLEKNSHSLNNYSFTTCRGTERYTRFLCLLACLWEVEGRVAHFSCYSALAPTNKVSVHAFWKVWKETSTEVEVQQNETEWNRETCFQLSWNYTYSRQVFFFPKGKPNCTKAHLLTLLLNAMVQKWNSAFALAFDSLSPSDL